MRLRLAGAFLVLALLTLPAVAVAQESWLEVIHAPRAYVVFMREGNREELSDWVVANQETLARVSLLSEGGVSDLKKALNKDPRANTLLALDIRQLTAGSYMVAIDRAPGKKVWQPQYFNRYLATNFLMDVMRERTLAQKTSLAARTITTEHYKTIVQVGNRYTEAITKPIGQELEIVPLNNPGTDARGQVGEFQVLFKGDPLVTEEVSALCRVLNVGRSQIYNTDSQGRILVTINQKGVWIIHVAYAHPSQDKTYDWRIYHSTLTFNTR